jgi:hypothetical protein
VFPCLDRNHGSDSFWNVVLRSPKGDEILAPAIAPDNRRESDLTASFTKSGGVVGRDLAEHQPIQEHALSSEALLMESAPSSRWSRKRQEKSIPLHGKLVECDAFSVLTHMLFMSLLFGMFFCFFFILILLVLCENLVCFFNRTS